MKIDIYTDGSCSINNTSAMDREGDGGFGYCILQDGILVYEYFDMYHNTTNNRMEMRAIISALDYCWEHYKDADITIYSDSAYIVNGINQKWYKAWMVNGWRNSKREPVKNPDLWKAILHSHDGWVKTGAIKFQKVTGHSSVKYNVRADQLANMWRKSSNENFSIDQESPDRGFERISTDQWLF